jgi:hypothetical protein
MIEDKLAQVGLRLPAAAKPSFAYAAVTLHDGVGYVSGQLPKIDGEVRVFGKVGREVTLDAAREEARTCVLQALACLQGSARRPVASAPGAEGDGLRRFGARLQRAAQGDRCGFGTAGRASRGERSACPFRNRGRRTAARRGGRDRIRSRLRAMKKGRRAKGRLAIRIDECSRTTSLEFAAPLAPPN